MIKRGLCLLLILLAGCKPPDQPARPDKTPERIISLAPNITETLRTLGLEEKLVGTSRFGDSDRGAAIPVVGDFMSVNYESIVLLKPDLVILERSSDEKKARLRSLGIPFLETCSLSIADVQASIRNIGTVCSVEKESRNLIGWMESRIDAARNTPAHRPRTLIAFSDFSDREKVEQIYAFGADCIHSELLAIAGGDNVVTNPRPSVILSPEAVLRMNPELIIELSAGGPTNHWANLSSVDAVRNHGIHVLEGTYTTIPSPEALMETLQDLSEIIRITEAP